MIVRELVTKLGFDADDKEVSSYENAMKGLKTTILGVGAAIAGIGAASFAFANSIAAQGNSLAKTAKGVGLSLKDYQELEYVLGRISTISKDQVGQGFRDASSRLAQARNEAGAMRDEFIKLGFTQEEIVSGGVSTNDVFMRLSEMAKDSTTEVAALVGAQRIFGEEVGRLLGPALRDTTDSVDDLRAKFQELSGGFSEEGAKSAEDYEDAMLNLTTVFDSLKISIGEGLLPILTSLVRSFTDVVAANKKLIQIKIKNFFEGVSAVGSTVFDALKAVWNVLDGIVSSFTTWDKVIKAIAVMYLIRTLGSLATVLKTIGGWIPIIAANLFNLRKILRFTGWGAFLLFWEDLYYWLEGNDSVFRRLLGTVEEFAKKFEPVVKLMRKYGILPEEKILTPKEFKDKTRGAIPQFNNLDFYNQSNMGNPQSDLLRQQGNKNSKQNINVNTKAELVVPPGTTEQQKEAMKKQADQIFDEYNRQITNSIIEFKAAE